MFARKLIASCLPAAVAALALGAAVDRPPDGVAPVSEAEARTAHGGQSGCSYFDAVYVACGYGDCGGLPVECPTGMALTCGQGVYGIGSTSQTSCWVCGNPLNCGVTTTVSHRACGTP